MDDDHYHPEKIIGWAFIALMVWAIIGAFLWAGKS